jgi:hypothetical protein
MKLFQRLNFESYYSDDKPLFVFGRKGMISSDPNEISAGDFRRWSKQIRITCLIADAIIILLFIAAALGLGYYISIEYSPQNDLEHANPSLYIVVYIALACWAYLPITSFIWMVKNLNTGKGGNYELLDSQGRPRLRLRD